MPAKDYGLTPAEHRALDALSRAEGEKVTARRLGLSPGTIKSHRNHLYQKLGVTTALEAVVKAFREGLVEIDDPCEQGRS